MPVWGTGGRWFESSHPDNLAASDGFHLSPFFCLMARWRHCGKAVEEVREQIGMIALEAQVGSEKR